MKMKNKLLLLFLAFLFFFTIKSNAQTYDQNNPLNTGYDNYLDNQQGAFTYNWFDNLGLGYYDFFTFTTRTSAMGNVYNEYANILYKNEDTKEIIYHNYYSGYDYAPIHKFYYVHNNTIIRINASRHINGSNYSYGHCVLFFEKNNDSTLKTVYFLDQVNGKGSNNYDNQVTRIIFTNNGNIYASGLGAVYSYTLATQTFTNIYNTGTSWTFTNAYDYISRDFEFVPTYTTLCENNTNTPYYYNTIMFNNNFDSINTAFCNGNWQDSINNDLLGQLYYGNYNDSEVIWSNSPTIPNKSITLSVIDENLCGKQFLFNFQLPQHKDDSVYYAIMDSYNRSSYNSVSATFTIYELFTPLEYTGSFSKYLIYDEKEKYFVPMARY